MNVQGPIRKIIADNTDAFAIFGTRVYPVVAPQNAALPFAVVTVVGSNPAHNKSAASWVDNVLTEVAIWGATFDEARQAEEAFRQAIDFFRRDVTFQLELTSIDGIRYEQVRQIYDNDSGFHCHIAQYTIRVNRQNAVGPPLPVYGRFFTHDADALAAGMQSGDLYFLSINNFYGLPYGVVKMIE